MKDTMRFLAAALLLMLAGCATAIHVWPRPALGIAAKTDIPVGLLIDEAQLQQVYKHGGWRIQVGEALDSASRISLRQMFRELVVVSSESAFLQSPARLLFRSSIARYYISPLTAVDLQMRCVVSDRSGNVVYDRTVSGYGAPRQANEWLGGVQGKMDNMILISAEAFQNAFRALTKDLQSNIRFSDYGE